MFLKNGHYLLSVEFNITVGRQKKRAEPLGTARKTTIFDFGQETGQDFQ
jgi:hypothetical protein